MNSKDLYELIHQNTRIILPEFGAFLVKDSGEKGFNPLNVSFSPFLRYNDGMLEVYIAKSRGISKEGAAKDVQEFVETIKNELLEKGVYEIEGLGFLKRDQRGSLSFSLNKPDDKINQEDKATPERPLNKKTTTPKDVQLSENDDDKKDIWLDEANKKVADESKAKKTRKVASSKVKVEKLTANRKSTEVKSIADEQPLEQDRISVTEPLIESKPEHLLIDKLVADKRAVQLNTDDQEKEKESKGDKPAEAETPIDSEKEVKKNRGLARLLYTSITIAILVVLFFVVKNYYLAPNVETIDENLSIKKTKNTLNDKIEPSNRPEKLKDDIDKTFNDLSNSKKGKQAGDKEQLKKEEEQEELIKNTLIKNAQTQNAKIIKATGIKFYIIAGSFKNPDFAEKFINELNKSGYKATIVIQPSGMNAVAIGAYNTREEANDAMKAYKSKLTNLWILKK